MISYNPKNKTYIAPINYLVNRYIYEYDITKANLNILFYKGIISKEKYDVIYQFPRDKRQYYFGMLQKDKKVADALSEGFAEFRQKFIEANQITDSELLSVKNDAFFLINKKPMVTKFGNVEFLLKNTYTSFYLVPLPYGKIELYYGLDHVNDKEILDIKGIKDSNIELHEDYMIEFLCTLFEIIQTKPLEMALNFVQEFERMYVGMNLDIGFYRELGPDSKYRITFPNGETYLLDSADNTILPYLNISNNLSIIRYLYSIISSMYFSKRK